MHSKCVQYLELSFLYQTILSCEIAGFRTAVFKMSGHNPGFRKIYRYHVASPQLCTINL